MIVSPHEFFCVANVSEAGLLFKSLISNNAALYLVGRYDIFFHIHCVLYVKLVLPCLYLKNKMCFPVPTHFRLVTVFTKTYYNMITESRSTYTHLKYKSAYLTDFFFIKFLFCHVVNFFYNLNYIK